LLDYWLSLLALSLALIDVWVIVDANKPIAEVEEAIKKGLTRVV
jgi:hypothetical protein